MGQDVRLLQLGEPSGELWPQRDGPLLDLHDPGASLSLSLSLSRSLSLNLLLSWSSSS